MHVINAMFGCGQGGIEQALIDYCEAAAFAGHRVTAVIHPRAEVRTALQSRNIAFHALPNAGSWDPVARWRLRRLVKRLNPDIVIAHGNRAVSLLAKAAPERRVVGVMHNYKIHSGNLRFIFYPTQDLLRHVRAEQRQGQHVYCIPNLVRAPAEYRPRAWHEPPVIGAMGRFVAKKGFELFLEALFLLKSRGIAFRAVLAGDGVEKQALRQLVAAKGLEPDVTFAGWVEHRQAFFAAADIFCLPSHHEPFGIVLLEAMAAGLPVVATASEGPSEILQHGINGLLVPKGEADALAGALANLLADRQRAQLMARNAFDTVKTRYDLPVVSAKLDLALRSISRL